MRKNRNTPGRKIAEAIIAEYKPQSVAEIGSVTSLTSGSGKNGLIFALSSTYFLAKSFLGKFLSKLIPNS